MTKVKLVFALIAGAAGTALLAGLADAGADLQRGERVFRRCLVCHTIAADRANGIGPNLHGLFDRLAGKAPGFAYSAGLAGAKFRWDDARLDRWLTDPQAYIPGARMAFRLADPQDRADVIAFLHQATK